MHLVPLLHFYGAWIYSCVSWRVRSLLWLHRLLIELQVDGVSGECEGFMIVIFTEAILYQFCAFQPLTSLEFNTRTIFDIFT